MSGGIRRRSCGRAETGFRPVFPPPVTRLPGGQAPSPIPALDTPFRPLPGPSLHSVFRASPPVLPAGTPDIFD